MKRALLFVVSFCVVAALAMQAPKIVRKILGLSKSSSKVAEVAVTKHEDLSVESSDEVVSELTDSEMRDLNQPVHARIKPPTIKGPPPALEKQEISIPKPVVKKQKIADKKQNKTKALEDKVKSTQAASTELTAVAVSTKTLETNFLKEILGEKFGLGMEMSYSSDFFKSSDNRHGVYTDLLINPSYAIAEKTKIGGYFLLGKSLVNDLDQQFSTDNFLYLSQGIGKFGKQEMFSLGVTLRTYLPFNSDARTDKTFRTRVYFRPTFYADLGAVGLTGLKIGVRAAFSKHFYKYKTAADGSSNTSYDFSPSVILRYLVSKKLEWVNLFAVSEGWDYLGTRRDEQYQWDSSLNYQINDTFDFSLGYVNSGLTYTPDQSELDIDLFDLERASFYTTLSITL